MMSDEFFLPALVAVAVMAGAIASVSGFGIGSILTPLLAWQQGTKLAVAAIAIPHLLGTALRFWRLREHIDRHVLRSFGFASAAGGLLGALLHVYFKSTVLAVVLGVLLVFAGLMQLTGMAERMRFRGAWAWVAGAASGGFGGLVGNQGGIRSAALLGFEPAEGIVCRHRHRYRPDHRRRPHARVLRHPMGSIAQRLDTDCSCNGRGGRRHADRRADTPSTSGACLPACDRRNDPGFGCAYVFEAGMK